ncbi:MAG: asparagine synthase (glutamine-hydrolyzing) [Bacteroidia bacterium]|jgi:asparagine synthase (glutamine-hydrolysing)
MCGIAGIFNFQHKPVDLSVLKQMSDTISYRGTDGEGIWINEQKNLGFAHRRLAIIDLSEEARQPMHYLGRYTIVYNGEIYNYIELKADLEKKGYQFVSHSDTEVILAAFDNKREKCLEDFDGMFAFAIWDNKLQQLFLARDRFGEKPLRYYMDSERLVFASEIKALFKAKVPKKVSKEKMENFLENNVSIYNTETFFDGIKKLPHGHYAFVQNGNIDIREYYRLQYRNIVAMDDHECAEEFRRLFFLSISRRLRSDVPVATSFSGGLDSSGIVCVMHQLREKVNYKLFSARFDDDVKDEGKWMKYITDSLHFPQVNKPIEPKEILEEIEKIVYHNEIPIGSTSVAAQYLLYKEVKNHHIKVILDGQGADEMLAGYGHYRFHYLNDLLLRFRVMEYMNERRAYNDRYQNSLPIGPWQLTKMFLTKTVRPFEDNTLGYQSFKAALFNDMVQNLQQLLNFSDSNSMAHGVEARLPFLYHKLVDFVFSLPANQIYRNATTKYVYRNAMKGIIPDVILNRKDKLGFAPPQERWLPQFKLPEKSRLREMGLTYSDNHWRNYISEVFLKVADTRY